MAETRTTHSANRSEAAKNAAYTRALKRLKISPEVGWYLKSRGIPLPTCPPKVKTPEPRNVPGSQFNPERVDRVLASFHALSHTQGKWAGQPLDPDSWQIAYILAPVFGWEKWDDESGQYVRIIRDLYVDVPRKNGKSTLAAGIAIYMACADGEHGAQVVTAATTKDQAKFVFNPIKTLAEKSPALSKCTVAYQTKVLHPKSGSYVEVVSALADAQHGANIHCSIVDELHVHKTPDLVEALETGRGSRSQPLSVIITTADEGKPNTIYDRRRRRVERLAAGVIKDPAIYGVVWAADSNAEPHREATWRAANPGLGVSPTLAYLKSASTNAKNSPADYASFLRLHLGIRTKQDAKYIELAEWERNAGQVDVSALKGRVAFGGLDLGNVADLTALCWIFPTPGGSYDLLWRFWLPADQVEKLDKRTSNAVSQWIADGYIEVTPGATTDYDFVIARVNADRALFKVKEIGYDPWNANQLTKQLADEHAPLVEVRQGYRSMSPPLKECKRLLAAGTDAEPLLRHGGNPVMAWMTDNLAVTTDPAGNVKPDKGKASEKIDGWSALVTGMSRAMHYKPRKSAYAAQ